VKEVNDLHNIIRSISSDITVKVKEHTMQKVNKLKGFIGDKFDWTEKVMRNNQDVSNSNLS
jgi:hypothetical protein